MIPSVLFSHLNRLFDVQDGGYHVPFAHKGLAAGLDMKSYQSTLYERTSIQSVESAVDAHARLSGETYTGCIGSPLTLAHNGQPPMSPPDPFHQLLQIYLQSLIWVQFVGLYSMDRAQIIIKPAER